MSWGKIASKSPISGAQEAGAGCQSSKCHVKTRSPFCQLPRQQRDGRGGLWEEGRSQGARSELRPTLRRTFQQHWTVPHADPGMSMKRPFLEVLPDFSDAGPFDHQHLSPVQIPPSVLLFQPHIHQLHVIKPCGWKGSSKPDFFVHQANLIFASYRQPVGRQSSRTPQRLW